MLNYVEYDSIFDVTIFRLLPLIIFRRHMPPKYYRRKTVKRIRLEIPLGDGDVYLPWKVWLKVNDNNTEVFSDRNFTNPIRDTRKKVSLDIDVPDKLQSIEIGGLGGLVPVAPHCQRR